MKNNLDLTKPSDRSKYQDIITKLKQIDECYRLLNILTTLYPDFIDEILSDLLSMENKYKILKRESLLTKEERYQRGMDYYYKLKSYDNSPLTLDLED